MIIVDCEAELVAVGDESENKQFDKGDVIECEIISSSIGSKYRCLILKNGDCLLDVPVNSFDIIY